MSLLLHDVGRLPFCHVLENNHWLKRQYQSENGLSLDHVKIARGLITSGPSRYRDIFREFVSKQYCIDPKEKCELVDETRLLSKFLQMLKVKVDVIEYFLDPAIKQPPDRINRRDQPFAAAVRELVSGVIDLDRLDHYHRDTHFVRTGVGEFNVRGLLSHLFLSKGDDPNQLSI